MYLNCESVAITPKKEVLSVSSLVMLDMLLIWYVLLSLANLHTAVTMIMHSITLPHMCITYVAHTSSTEAELRDSYRSFRSRATVGIDVAN